MKNGYYIDEVCFFGGANMNIIIEDRKTKFKIFVVIVTLGLCAILHMSYKFGYTFFFFVILMTVLIIYSKKHYVVITREKANAINQEVEETQTILIQQEKLASLGQLAAGVAHELNNPIGFVNSNINALKDYIIDINNYIEALEKETENHEKIRQAHKDIDFILEDMPSLIEESLEGLSRVAGIVKSLKDYSRIDFDDTQEYCFKKGVQATLIVARNTYRYVADVETTFNRVPLIRVNGNQINEVLLNLIVNAAQAIEGQERIDKGLIRINVYTEDDNVVCEVNDDGPGIEQEYIGKIFDPFFTTKPPGKGTGLGLNIAYNTITQKNKGELLVKSEVGVGTTFTIKLHIRKGEIDENSFC